VFGADLWASDWKSDVPPVQRYQSLLPIGGRDRHSFGVDYPFGAIPKRRGNVMGKVMLARPRSKTVAFVAIFAALTFGALATASAQPTDIKAIDKTFQDHYAHGNYPAAHTDAQELERRVKARFGTDHPDCPSSEILRQEAS
jgi:hypothetical protein